MNTLTGTNAIVKSRDLSSIVRPYFRDEYLFLFVRNDRWYMALIVPWMT